MSPVDNNPLDNEAFDELFHARFQGHRMPPPPGAWQAIQADIEPARRPLYWAWLTAAVLVVGLGTLGVFSWLRPDGDQPIALTLDRASSSPTSATQAPKAGSAPDITSAPSGGTTASNAAPASTEKENTNPEYTSSNTPQVIGSRKKGTGTSSPGAYAQEQKREFAGIASQAVSPTEQGPDYARPVGAAEPQHLKSGKGHKPKSARQARPGEEVSGLALGTKPLRSNTRKKGLEATSTSPSQESETQQGSQELATIPQQGLPSAGIVNRLRTPEYISNRLIDSLRQALAAAPTLRNKEKLDSAQGKKRAGHWSVEGFVMPRYTFSRFKPNSNDEMLITQVKGTNQYQNRRLGWEAGFRLAYTLPRWEWQAGLSLARIREQLDYTMTLPVVSQMAVEATPSGNTYRIIPTLKQLNNQVVSEYYYTSLNLSGSYYLVPSQRFRITGGTGLNLLAYGLTSVRQNGELISRYSFPDPNNPLEQFNMNFFLGVGYKTQLFERIEVIAEPSISYYAFSTLKEREPLSIQPWMMGVNLAVRYKLN